MFCCSSMLLSQLFAQRYHSAVIALYSLVANVIPQYCCLRLVSALQCLLRSAAQLCLLQSQPTMLIGYSQVLTSMLPTTEIGLSHTRLSP